MKLIIDRFEEEYVICEDENLEMVQLKRDIFPTDATEGDICYYQDGQIQILFEETAKKRAELKNRLGNLFKK